MLACSIFSFAISSIKNLKIIYKRKQNYKESTLYMLTGVVIHYAASHMYKALFSTLVGKTDPTSESYQKNLSMKTIPVTSGFLPQ